ncbi:hypothetical protein BHE74_00016054 [Ensete ventricosum]|nr:hypothetical protein BHE74_00016054 [Ensete ventricosum]
MEGYGSGNAAVREWAAVAVAGKRRGQRGPTRAATEGRKSSGVRQRSVWLGAMGATSAGSEGRKGEQGNDRRMRWLATVIKESKAAGWPVLSWRKMIEKRDKRSLRWDQAS